MKNNIFIMAIASLILIVIGLIFIVLGTPKKEIIIGKDRFDPITQIPPTNKKLNFKIVDRTEICAQALEKIYEDDTIVCHLPCIKSGSIYLVYDDGSEITLRKALDEKRVTIEELREAKLMMYCETVNETN